MKDKVLIHTTLKPDLDPDLCLLTLRTVRKGFPTSHIELHHNSPLIQHDELIRARCKPLDIPTRQHGLYHHADWIAEQLFDPNNSGYRLFFLDGDLIFYNSLEDLFFPGPMCGHFIPRHFSDFYRAPVVERLHTSLLVIPDTTYLSRQIFEVVTKNLPSAIQKSWASRNLIHPFRSWFHREEYVYDTCAGLYHCVGGHRFPTNVLEAYFHVNSACLYPSMVNHILSPTAAEEYKKLCVIALNNPEALRNQWHQIEEYYDIRQTNFKIIPHSVH